jgi:tRNA-specific 2-thiouridylase
MNNASKSSLKDHLVSLEKYLAPMLSGISPQDKIAVGMSGGVDSAVTLLLLKELGLNVFGVFMRNWVEQDNSGTCLSEYEYRDVIDVCEQLHVPYYSVDLSKDYWERVFKTFLYEIKSGLTPNPDVLCNKEIKFDAFWLALKKMGAAKIATGHYARTSILNDQCALLKAVDDSKDQTYFLSQMPRQMLANVLFPLGIFKKTQVRDIARMQGLSVKDKKDSTGICFIGERDFKEFVSQYISSTQGDFVDVHSKKVLGRHDGSCFYTIGQRKGLALGGPQGPWFVVSKDSESNVVFVTNDEQDPLLFATSCVSDHSRWLVDTTNWSDWIDATCRVRYRQKDSKARFRLLSNESVETLFLEPQRAVTAGQYIAFYQEDICLGAAQIHKINFNN